MKKRFKTSNFYLRISDKDKCVQCKNGDTIVNVLCSSKYVTIYTNQSMLIIEF